MKFFCEYCGNVIDANEDDKCPNCGATYRKNKSFLKLQEEKNKEDQQNKEFKQQVRNQALGTIKASKWLILVPIIMFVVVVSIVIFIIVSFTKDFNNKSNQINDGVNSIFDSVNQQIKDQLDEDLKEEKEPEKVTVGFDEYGSTDEYKVKVTKYEVVEDIFNRVEEGYELVKFHLVVENISGEEIDREDVNCIVDGVAQNNDIYSGHSELPFDIPKDLAVKGTATFEVPKNATSYDLKYGDYIKIYIEK